MVLLGFMEEGAGRAQAEPWRAVLWCRGETQAPNQARSACALRAQHCPPSGSEDLEGQR